MAKRGYLRRYPKTEEPKIFTNNFWTGDIVTDEQAILVFDFFQMKLALRTEWKSLNGKKYIEGTFIDADNREVKLRYYYKDGIYKNMIINDDPSSISDIRAFKTLWQLSPYISLP